jgi:hypothetical protein
MGEATPSSSLATADSALPEIQIPVSLGELADRVTIVALKARHLQGEALAHVLREQQLLQATLEPLRAQVPEQLHHDLAAVNGQLWGLEDAVRDCERRGSFGEPFVAMARSIYRLNDRRASLKRAISLAGGSALVEQKVYGGNP